MTKTLQRIACFGGIYSNHLALATAIDDARRRGVDAMYCLGDFGGFGPHPNRTLELLRGENIECIQGNYDHSIGNKLDDCQCGYTDPRDNHFAQISYEYTLEKTDEEHCRWMRSLPHSLPLSLGAPFASIVARPKTVATFPRQSEKDERVFVGEHHVDSFFEPPG